MGGLLLLFSDITGELKLKAQYNALIQVQQATLDKLNDAVAVFGSDGRLRLHNEAFERFWASRPRSSRRPATSRASSSSACPSLHDMNFWRELKGRVADPDPPRAADLGRGQDLRRPHRRLPVPPAAGRRDPDRLHRRHRRPKLESALAAREPRSPRPSG
jgi:hypothetical protein